MQATGWGLGGGGVCYVVTNTEGNGLSEIQQREQVRYTEPRGHV